MMQQSFGSVECRSNSRESEGGREARIHDAVEHGVQQVTGAGQPAGDAPGESLIALKPCSTAGGDHSVADVAGRFGPDRAGFHVAFAGRRSDGRCEGGDSPDRE